MTAPKISVCIASRGEPDVLSALVEALQELNSPVAWELVLVLNGMHEPRGTKAYASGIELREMIEPEPGKGRCLNRAIDAARGELLVFSDDDVKFHPDWLVHLWNAAETYKDVVVFGGAILPLGKVPKWIERSANLQGILLTQHVLSTRPTVYPFGSYPFGPNMAVRRAAVARATARWLEDMGPGTRLPVGDETAFLSQVSAPQDRTRLFVPDAVVFHQTRQSYFSIANAIQRCYLCGVAVAKAYVPAGPEPRAQDVLAVVRRRVRKVASLRELMCICARALGYLRGRYLSWPTGCT